MLISTCDFQQHSLCIVGGEAQPIQILGIPRKAKDDLLNAIAAAQAAEQTISRMRSNISFGQDTPTSRRYRSYSPSG